MIRPNLVRLCCVVINATVSAPRAIASGAAFITVDLTAINLSLDHTALVLSLFEILWQ